MSAVPHSMSLRAGRQEVVFGTGRLFDNNEGPNVKLSFDGFRAIAETSHVRLDLFAMRPVEDDDQGYFDDEPNHAQSVWGSYLTVPAPIVSRGQADFYYIGLDTKSVIYNRGIAHELRHTIGTRVFRPIGKGLDYNLITSGEVSGAPRFAHGAYRQKPGLRLIAYTFFPGHCYGPTYIAATAILRIALSEPTTPFTPVVHTLPPRPYLLWGLRT